MAVLYSIVFFFLALLLIYPAAAAVLSLTAWLRKRRAMQADSRDLVVHALDEQTDKLKNMLFLICIIISFFVIAPFFALLMIIRT